MKTKINLFFLFIVFNVFSQSEANIWYFGEIAGLDFNSGSPVKRPLKIKNPVK